MEPERSRGRRGGGGGGRGGRGQGRGWGREPRDSHGDRQQQQQQQHHQRPGEADRGWRGTAGRSGSRGKRQPQGRYQQQPPPLAPQQQQEDEDDVDTKEEENEPNKYSRRKIVSNLDKYKTKGQEEGDDVGESTRGADFNVLLSSAGGKPPDILVMQYMDHYNSELAKGDSFAQFRFAEEKEWEVDIVPNKQMSPLFVNCQALAQSLQELPIYLRLNLEPQLVQITPAEIPQIRLKSKHDGLGKFSQFGVPTATLGTVTSPPTAAGTFPAMHVPDNLDTQTSNLALNLEKKSSKNILLGSHKPADKLDEELDFLLNLENSAAENIHDCLKETTNHDEVIQRNAATESFNTEVIDNRDPPTAEVEETEANKLAAEEDLEDWLDSMIS